jgi:type VI protein secretion system component VasF
MLSRFFPLMSSALSSTQAGDLSLVEIGSRLRALAQAERELPPPEAEGGPKNAPDLSTCRLAVYAWVDETLLNAPRQDAVAWAAQSLQQTFFQTAEAGILFFRHLDTLLDSLLPRVDAAEGDDEEGVRLPDRLAQAARLSRAASPERGELDVFALCLLLGFQGRLYGQTHLCGKLRQAARKVLEGSEGFRPIHDTTGKRRRKTLPPVMEWLFYAFLPLAGTLLFALYCASFLTDVPRVGP